mgnify:CR=1 FL=1
MQRTSVSIDQLVADDSRNQWRCQLVLLVDFWSPNLDKNRIKISGFSST